MCCSSFNRFISYLPAFCLGVALLSGCDREQPKYQSTDNWKSAWSAAETIGNPVDEGFTKGRIANEAALNGHGDLLIEWAAAERQPWVKSLCLASLSYARAFQGDLSGHKSYLLPALRTVQAADEWDRVRVVKSLLKATAAGVWMENQDVAKLRAWVGEGDIERTPATAAMLCDWLETLRSQTTEPITKEKKVVEAIDFILARIGRFRPVDRLELVVRLAPLLVESKKEDELILAVKEFDSASDSDYEVLTALVILEAALGREAEAARRFGRAKERAAAKQTGDCIAPYVRLAKAAEAVGVDYVGLTSIYRQGLEKSGDRPGFHGTIAKAMTYAAMARFEESFQRTKSR